MKMKLNVIFIVGTLLLLLPLVAGSHEEEELSCDLSGWETKRQEKSEES